MLARLLSFCSDLSFCAQTSLLIPRKDPGGMGEGWRGGKLRGMSGKTQLVSDFFVSSSFFTTSLDEETAVFSRMRRSKDLRVLLHQVILGMAILTYRCTNDAQNIMAGLLVFSRTSREVSNRAINSRVVKKQRLSPFLNRSGRLQSNAIVSQKVSLLYLQSKGRFVEILHHISFTNPVTEPYAVYGSQLTMLLARLQLAAIQRIEQPQFTLKFSEAPPLYPQRATKLAVECVDW